jgi:general secretion pathway protein D
MVHPLRSSLSLLLIGGLLLAQAPPAAAPPATVPAAPAPTVPGGFNLPNAPLLDVIDILARDLHLNYILDARIPRNSTVTINTYGTIRAEDMRPIFETILRMNGLVMVQVGNIYRISPANDVSHLPISPQVNMKDFPDDERILLNMIFLKYMTAPEMEAIIKPFLGESATMVSYLPANLLMIEDNSRNMKRTTELINLFDADTFAGQRVQTFATQNSRPSDLVKELDTVFRAYALNEKTSAIRFLPIDRINLVLAVAANPGVLVQVKEWIAKLDIPVRLPVGAVSNYVYKLKYGRAEIIGSVLTQLYGGSAGGFGSGLSSQFAGAGQRFQGGGSQFNPGGGGGGFGSSFGSSFPGGGVGGSPFGSGAGSGVVEAPSALSGAFGAAPNITVVNPAATGGAGAGAPGTTRDQTGQYLSSSGQPNLNQGLPRIIPNPFDNTLIVQGTPQMWEQILHLLDQIDVSPRQVLIDAKIYEITLTGAFSFGVQGFLQQQTASSSSTARQLVGSFAASGATVLNAGLLLGRTRELLGAVTFAESVTKAKIVSSPSLIATDSIPATISVGTDVPTLSAQAVSPGLTNGGTSQFTQSISNVSTGTTLGILARVNASGVVTLVIDQSVTAPVPPAPGGINSPSFSKRNVSTQVTVQDGDTIAIAGIILEQDLLGRGGIPILDRLPWIGGAFGSTSSTKIRTELIIFLTPRVIYDTNQISDATEELRQKVKTLTKLMRDKS